MNVSSLNWQISSVDFEKRAEGKPGTGYIFVPPDGTKHQPLAIIFGRHRVTIIAQRRSLRGNIQYMSLYVRTSDFWDLYKGMFEIDGKRHYTKIATYPTAVGRIFAFTGLPVWFFDQPLPPDKFLTEDELRNQVVQLLVGFY